MSLGDGQVQIWCVLWARLVLFSLGIYGQGMRELIFVKLRLCARHYGVLHYYYYSIILVRKWSLKGILSCPKP